MARRKGQKKLIQTFVTEFRFLLDIDPALEGWRAWAAEYWAGLPKKESVTQAGLTAFLISDLHGQGLHTLPAEAFFAQDGGLPAPDAALGLGLIITETNALNKHDVVSDFLDPR